MKSFVLSCLRHCAPTLRDNPKEITVSNFATTFDNALQTTVHKWPQPG